MLRLDIWPRMATVWHRATGSRAARATASARIFAIARNLFINALRRRHALSSSSPSSRKAELPVLLEAAEDRVYLTQLGRHPRAIIKALPREQGEPLRRSLFEYQLQSAIARELDLPLDTVKSRQRLAFSR